jgi:putative membrane protein
LIDFPLLNASLNATSAVLIGMARYQIGKRNINAHRNLMIAAVCTSTLFLASYLYYHFAVRHGTPTRFPGTGIARVIYFTVLTTHTILAAAIVPMIIVSIRRGLRRDDVAHRRIARWTYPFWMYVSVTGVLIYLMLYRWFA